MNVFLSCPEVSMAHEVLNCIRIILGCLPRSASECMSQVVNPHAVFKARHLTNLTPFLVLNKIDKVSNFDKSRIITLFLDACKKYGLNLVHIDRFDDEKDFEIPYLEFSALKKTNLKQLKLIIQRYLN